MYASELKDFVIEMVSAIQEVMKDKIKEGTLTKEMSFFHRGQIDAWVVMAEQMEEYKVAHRTGD